MPHLMIGSPADCHKTAVEAAQQAVRALNGLKPAFGLILVDVAWYMLMQARVDAYFKAIQDTLGPNVPIAGGYTAFRADYPCLARRTNIRSSSTRTFWWRRLRKESKDSSAKNSHNHGVPALALSAGAC